MLTEYVYLGDQLLAMIKLGESVYYYHNDHLGTPQILTDGSGNIAWKAVYTPFGGAVASIQTVENPFRFPGQYYDAETGLHYNYFRYYDPTTGRYITPDPIGLEGGINLFVYVQNDPINWMDSIGLRNGFRTGKGLMGPEPVTRAPQPQVPILPRFVGYTYADLLKFTLENRGPWGEARLSQEVERLKSKKAASIPCMETVTGQLYFIIGTDVTPLYILTPEDPRLEAPNRGFGAFFKQIWGTIWNTKKEQSVTIVIRRTMR